MEQSILDALQHSKIINAGTDYVKRLGNHFSIAMLNPICKFFSRPDVDGIIGYKTYANCVIVMGDPLCNNPQDISALTYAFHTFCQNHYKNVIYVVTSESFTNWALDNTCTIALQIGNELILDPRINYIVRSGRKASQLRNKYNQSVRAGLIVHEYIQHDIQMEKEIEKVGASWLNNRSGIQLFNLPINIFAGRANKRWFYAQYHNKIVGVLILNKLDFHQGWVLNVVMLTSDAPNTTSEFLVLNMLETLRTEQCPFFSVGTLPTHQLGHIEGFGAIGKHLVKCSFTMTRLLQLHKRQRYWQKFQPETKPSFLLFSKPRIRIREVWAIARAFSS